MQNCKYLPQKEQLPRILGKSNKTFEENVGGFLVSAVHFLQNSEDNSKQKKFEKYMTRIQEMQKISPLQLVQTVEFNKALFYLIINAQSLPFETKKQIGQLLSSSSKISKEDGGHVIHPTCQFLKQYLQEIVQTMVSQIENADKCSFATCILKSLLKTELYEEIVNLNLIEKLMELTEKNCFLISSSALDIYEIIFKRNNTLLNSFLEENFEKVFKILHQIVDFEENYFANREALVMIYNTLTDSLNQNIKIRYINQTKYLVRIMKVMKNTDKEMKKQAILLFGLYITNINQIENNDIILIIQKNKNGLIKYINNYKAEDDSENCIDKNQLLQQLKNVQNL